MSVIQTACDVVPALTVTRKRLEGRKAVPTPHARRVLFSQGTNAGYRLLARCVDFAPGDTPATAFPRWQWEVGFFVFADGHGPAIIPAGHVAVRADVTRFQIESRGVVAAPQLALLRHMFVLGIQAIDPQALVFGGQRGWRTEWWPDLVETPAR